tara:strand:+ start:893 stop:1564 length:672 start_codon:yes stop_codon:yes gene_type:complete
MKPKKCAIASTPRAGTHYLRMSLDNHPKIGWAGEFFRSDSEYRDLPLHIDADNFWKEHFEIKDYIYDGTISPFVNKFCYVGFAWHLTLDSDLPFSKVDKFILLERKYKLAQFVSLKIATKTGSWRDTKSTEKIEVNLEEYFQFLNNNNLAYENFKQNVKEYKKVYYEDLCKDFNKTINSIQDYLNVERFDIEPSTLNKQEQRPLRKVIKNYEEIKLYDGFYKI